MWKNAYLRIKILKLSRALNGPWTLVIDGSLNFHGSNLLHQQLLASEAGTPPWQNLGTAPG